MKSIAVYNPEREEVAVIEEDTSIEIDMRGFEGYRVKEYLVMESSDLKQTNSAKEEKVAPKHKKEYEMDQGIFKTVMKKASWNVIRLG